MTANPDQHLKALKDRLKELHERTLETPLYNAVFQVGFELSRQMERDEIALDDVLVLQQRLEDEAFCRRAERLRRFLAPLDQAENTKRLANLLDDNNSDDSFGGFQSRWEKPQLHCVFTGHPTFMMTPENYATLAAHATHGKSDAAKRLVPADRGPITIESEHDQAMAAIDRAQNAFLVQARCILEQARQHHPENWRALRPAPVNFGTWVGYDMDGRTDIAWTTSVHFRLLEKQRQLGLYKAELERLIHESGGPDSDKLQSCLKTLEAAYGHAARMSDIFSRDLDSPEALNAAANALSQDTPERLTSLDPLIADLTDAVDMLPDAAAGPFYALISLMQQQRLGVGTVHFRINASQLHNAIRRRLDTDESLIVNSRAALARLRDLLGATKPLAVNFAALAIETTTAIRQFLAMVQILKHIDSDSPIRMLIAECEQPVTVLSALYFTKLFGIEDKVDVSPLFETEAALEHGARLLDALMSERAYRDYVRQRGRLAIQTGFSDAGRFIGQIPAALAIERLQGRLASLMAKHGLSDVSALVFNTHGESMGRGAHPAGMNDRLAHPLSPWARTQFRRAGITLEAEASFQGGDGYLFFGTDELALATLTRIVEGQLHLNSLDGSSDPFYEVLDLSLDFYRSLRREQASLLVDPNYSKALMAFGLPLLRPSGSRKSRRQSDIMQERDLSLRRIRAIPNNAVLQQLGYPANVLTGIGTAVEFDLDGFVDLYYRSDRARSLLRMANWSKSLASIKTLVAYGDLYNGAFWSTRPYRGQEAPLQEACLDLAEHLANDNRTPAFRRLATRLRIDSLKLHRLLDRLPDEDFPDTDDDVRRTLGVLHALRLALLQFMFLKAVQIPPFSQRNDISRDDIVEMIFELRVSEAVDLLEVAYPKAAPGIELYDMTEPTDYPDEAHPEYGGIHRQYIEPIARSYEIVQGIGTAIAHYFGAHG